MGKPGAEQSVHSDWKATQIKVADVLFAMVHDVDNRPAVSLKTSPELAELLRSENADVRPSARLNKAHWSTVFLDGSLPKSQIYDLVDASYTLAVEALPDTGRQQLSVELFPHRLKEAGSVRGFALCDRFRRAGDEDLAAAAAPFRA